MEHILPMDISDTVLIPLLISPIMKRLQGSSETRRQIDCFHSQLCLLMTTFPEAMIGSCQVSTLGEKGWGTREDVGDVFMVITESREEGKGECFIRRQF